MIDSPERLTGENDPSSIEEVSKRALAQNEALKAALLKGRLEANGYTPAMVATRRAIYEDLQSTAHNGFGPDYRPTMGEVLDKDFGRDNWATVPTGNVTDDPDPWGNESAETTAWQNRELELFVRLPGTIIENPGFRAASQLEAEIESQFPRITG